MVERGVPEPDASAMLGFQAASVGREAFTTDEVETILGRPALTYAEWVSDHAGAFGAP
jgi:hypothetical protein